MEGTSADVDNISRILQEDYREVIYLIVTRLDISFVVGGVSQHMKSLKHSHWMVVCCILRYL